MHHVGGDQRTNLCSLGRFGTPLSRFEYVVCARDSFVRQEKVSLALDLETAHVSPGGDQQKSSSQLPKIKSIL